MIRRSPSSLTVTLDYEVPDGEILSRAKGQRHQIGYLCEVTATCHPGEPRTWEHPGEGPSVDIVKVFVKDIVIYMPPNYDGGVSIDSREDHCEETLAAYSKECQSMLEGDRDFADEALLAAGEEWSERRCRSVD